MRCKLPTLLPFLVLAGAAPAAAAPLLDEPLPMKDVLTRAASDKIDHELAIRDLAPAWVRGPAATRYVGAYVEEVSRAVDDGRLAEPTGISLILGLAAAAETGTDLRAPDNDIIGLLARSPMPRRLAETVDGAIILHRLGTDDIHPHFLGGDEIHPYTEAPVELLGFMEMANPIAELRGVLGAYADHLDSTRTEVDPLGFSEIKDLIMSFSEVSGLSVEFGRSGGLGIMPGDNISGWVVDVRDYTATDDLWTFYAPWLQSQVGQVLDELAAVIEGHFKVEIEGVSAGYAWADLDRFVDQNIDSDYLPKELTDRRPDLIELFDEADALFGAYGAGK